MDEFDVNNLPLRYRSDTRSVNSDGCPSPTNSKRSGKPKLDCKVAHQRNVIAFIDQLGNISAALQSPISFESEVNKATPDIIMPEHSIFGQEIKQHFDAVLNQSENGVRVTNIMMDYFNEVAEAYTTFTSSIANIAKEKLSNLNDIKKKGDRMNSTFTKCCKFLENSSNLAEKYKEHNGKLYNEVNRDFSKFQSEHIAEAKEINRRAKILRTGHNEQIKLVEEEKKKNHCLLEFATLKKIRKRSLETFKAEKVIS